MIIEIRKSEKLINNDNKSGFVKFKYNPKIVAYFQNLKIRKYQPKTHEWEIPLYIIPQIRQDFPYVEIIGNADIKEKESLIPTTYKFKTTPFPHQLEGIEFGLEKERFLLCDEQGLGKTFQIINWAEILFEEKNVNKILIVCGVNSLKYNWQSEIETHSNNKGYVLGTRYRKTTGKLYEGTSNDKLEDLYNLPKDCKFIITNIETLRAGAKKISKLKYDFPIANKIKELCDSGIIGAIAFDECHKSKNPMALQSRAMEKINVPYMVAMSGTPLMNNPLDLYFPLKWLGYEEHSFYQFKQHYCRLGGWGGAEVIGYKNLDELRYTVNSIMIRRLKKDVLNLPEKIHQIELVDMTNKQARIYNDVLSGIRKNIHKIRLSNNPLSMLIHLRQATGWTGILSDNIKESAKMSRMVELVDEITSGDNKCIIFSNWVQITSVAKELLKNYNPAYITGETSSTERLIQVDNFQNNENCKVIIGTLGAMGTGLTLTAGQTVIFLDSPWNRALKDQAEDRAHRIGTSGTVNIITICCKNTIDERIEDIVYKKGVMSDRIIDGKISNDDIDYLLS